MDRNDDRPRSLVHKSVASLLKDQQVLVVTIQQIQNPGTTILLHTTLGQKSQFTERAKSD